MRRYEWLPIIVMAAAVAACGGGETPAESANATAATNAHAAPSSDVAPRLEAAGDTWNALANEFQRFTLATPAIVRYGFGSTWNELVLIAGAYTCGNGLFNDPVPGVVKRCESLQTPPAPPPPPTESWTFVADEWQSFTLAAAATVRYGAGGTWVERALAAGTATCSNAFFGGDPIPNVVKRCEARADTVPPTPGDGSWRFLADEWGSFTLEQAQRVRYGAGANWAERDLPAGTGACSNAFFGVDPAPGVVKRCEAWTAATTAGPLEPTLLGRLVGTRSRIAGSADGRVLAYWHTNEVYASTAELRISEDRGATWRRTGWTNREFSGVVVSADGAHIVATMYRDPITAGVLVSVVLVSSDTGRTWRSFETRLSSPGDPDVHLANLHAISPDGAIVVATSDDGRHVATSRDGGATWGLALTTPDDLVVFTRVFVSPDSRTIEAIAQPLYSSVPFTPSAYRSTDAGRTWSTPQPVDVTNDSYRVSADMRMGYAYRQGRLARSTDAGATWNGLADVSITHVKLLSIDGRVVIGLRWLQEPVISRDFGVTWQPITNPVANTFMSSEFLSADGSTALFLVNRSESLTDLYIARRSRPGPLAPPRATAREQPSRRASRSPATAPERRLDHYFCDNALLTSRDVMSTMRIIRA